MHNTEISCGRRSMTTRARRSRTACAPPSPPVSCISLLGVCLGTLEPPASECAAQQHRESKKDTDEGEKSDEVKETLPEWIARLIPLADQFGARLASKVDSAACEH